MEHEIRIIETRLSDGSEVYDVWFDGVVLPCINQNDAIELMSKFIAAIGSHTNETVMTCQFAT